MKYILERMDTQYQSWQFTDNLSFPGKSNIKNIISLCISLQNTQVIKENQNFR